MKSAGNIFFITYIIIATFSIMTESSVGENLVDTNGKIFIFGLIMTLLEIPLIYYVIWKMILEKIADAMSYEENVKKLCSFLSFIALPIIFTSINMIVIDSLNESFDKSKPVKRYLEVTRTYSQAMHRSRDRRTDTKHMELTSWVSKGTFSVRITKKEFENTNQKDVYEAITRSGFFGFSYYKSLKKIDKNIFPPNTTFPLNEDEALKLIEEKKQQNLEEK